MGDIWPYGAPKYVSFDDAMNAAHGAGFGTDGARVMAAIGTAESSRDLTVINDTAATGDYSVGVWQINYYGSLYAGRVSAFGTPRHLIKAGIGAQAAAAFSIWQSQGLDAWSTYKSGAYKQYLGGGSAPGTPIGAPQQLPGHDISPPDEDYSPTLRHSAESLTNQAASWSAAARALANLRK